MGLSFRFCLLSSVGLVVRRGQPARLLLADAPPHAFALFRMNIEPVLLRSHYSVSLVTPEGGGLGEVGYG